MLDRSRFARHLLLLPLLLAGCASHLAGSPTAATGGPATPATVQGTLIDTHCYSIDRAFRADDHKTASGTIEGCAGACARLGIPVAILTASGEVVTLLAPAPELADHMSDEARAVGTRVMNGALRPDSIFVRGADGAWTPISLHQMM